MPKPLLLLLLFSLALCQYTVLQDSLPDPTPYSDVFRNDNLTFMLGEDVTVQYQNYFSEFQGQVYERTPPIQGDLINDFSQNFNSYKPSTLCNLFDADFEFNDLESYNCEDDTVLATSAVNEHDQVVYMLTNNATLLELKYIKNLSLPENATDFGFVNLAESAKNHLHYHGKTKSLYLLNQRGLFLVHPKKNETNTILVKGFQMPLPIKRHEWVEDRLIIITQKSVSIYNIEKQIDFVLEQTIDNYSGQPIAVADAKISGNYLWILDQIFGLYKFDLNTETKKYAQTASYKVPYGTKLMLAVLNDCIQVVFQLYKDTYIAQLFLRDNNLYLNRFYDQITGIRQVLLLGQLMLVLGQTQTMIIWHSINQKKLLQMDWQNKKFADGFGVLDIQLVPSSSNTTTLALAALSVDGFQFLTANRTNTVVKCNLQPLVESDEKTLLGSHSIMVALNSTLCSNQSPNNFSGGNYCKALHSFNFKVTRPTERKLSLIISVGLFIVSLTLAIVLVALSINYRKNRRGELDKMRDLLRRKQQQYEKTRNSAMGGPSEIVDV